MATAAAAAAAAAGEGGFDAELLRAEIQRDLRKYCQGAPFGKVYREQYPLMEQGDLTVPYHVWIGPSNWDKDPVELNREHEKLECLNQLLLQAMKNVGGNNNNLLLQLIIDVDGKLGDTSSYHGCEGLERKDFVKRMLLDGCYIVFKFAKCPHKDNGRPSPGQQGSYHGLLHMKLVDSCCRLITKCMNRIRGVHNTPDLESGGFEMQPVGETEQPAAATAEEAGNNSNHNDNITNNMAVEVPQIGESAHAAAAAEIRANNNNSSSSSSGRRSRNSSELARWLECRDTWCLVNNNVPYDVLDVINRLVYEASEGVFGGKSARILLQSWSMYSNVGPSQENHVDIDPRATVQQAGDANCLLILLAQLLKPQLDSPQLNEGEQLLPQYRWRRATEYDRRCNARFVAAPLDATERRTVLDVTTTIRGCFCCIDVQVPPLTIDGCSLALLRSLVDLERRGITAERYVTAYCLFMHKIASRAEDVELLTEQGILKHGYSDPMDVARGLEQVVAIAHASDAHPYLLPIEHELGWRYESTVHWCLSWFRVSYWTRSHVLMSLLVGVVGLIYTALSYHHRNK